MLSFLAKVGLLVGSSTASVFWYFEDVECPKSLIK